MKLESSREIFEKYNNVIFPDNPFSGSGRTDGQTERQTHAQTDRHKGAISRFSQFCECS
jgi:hypothetical protein